MVNEQSPGYLVTEGLVIDFSGQSDFGGNDYENKQNSLSFGSLPYQSIICLQAGKGGNS